MKRAEIEERINMILSHKLHTEDGMVFFGIAQEELTDLFIELSNERCIDQRIIASDEYLRVSGFHEEVANDAILNAPLPEIN